ncbi:MAG TPA: aminodeoxychorismate/anthranilate synthase component II [Bacteroidetes bacterium]|nr:aminodeoxychorismate/anthranilate synthase component II [Bacteroidota bacterium]
MILFIDNYDSFTYNLVDYFGRFEPNLMVVRNDKISSQRIRNLKPRGIVISPGPGVPENAGICNEVIKNFYKDIPILGVCLGHQCIGSVFGTKIKRAPAPVHGKTADIYHHSTGIFSDLPSPFQAARYHSLMIDKTTLSTELEIVAETDDKIIMGIQHKRYPVIGVQFHPESILTGCGFSLLENWLKMFVRP